MPVLQIKSVQFLQYQCRAAGQIELYFVLEQIIVQLRNRQIGLIFLQPGAAAKTCFIAVKQQLIFAGHNFDPIIGKRSMAVEVKEKPQISPLKSDDFILIVNSEFAHCRSPYIKLLQQLQHSLIKIAEFRVE